VITYFQDHLSAPLQLNAHGIDLGEATSVYPEIMARDAVASREDSDFLANIADGSAIRAGKQGVQLVARGSRSHTVAITDIRARILRKEPAPNGTLFYAPQQGELTNVQFGVDLGSTDLSMQQVARGKWLGPYFRRKTYTLRNDEVASFTVTAYASSGYSYYWDLEVDLIVDGKNRVEHQQDQSGPFRLSSLSKTYGEVVIGDTFPLMVMSGNSFCRNFDSSFCTISRR
jgi:hypothetical protein